MLNHIKGLHHVTGMAKSAVVDNGFWTGTLGLRRVKQTVNFDEPSVYHLYYGDETGSPGSVMTTFPFPDIGRGRPGTGEVGTTVFSVPEGSLDWWEKRLTAANVRDLSRDTRFGENRLQFSGPEGEGLALIEHKGDTRKGWTGGGIDADHAIRGFHSASLRLRDEGATAELLGFMGYDKLEHRDGITRLVKPGGNGANFVDIETLPGASRGAMGAGSVHHLAFAVDNRATQLEVRKALADTGYQLTPVIDRDYFWSVYFRTPGGVLFEIATSEPGFDRDEDTAHLGEALKLPHKHEHLRSALEAHLEPLS
jgi:glyoxalase family protein